MAISYVTAASLDGTQNGSAPIYGARAWVNFNGTGTVAIRASGNVTSITDNGTGDYTVNFTVAMTDANYSAVTSASSNATNPFSEGYSNYPLSFATTSVRVFYEADNNTAIDGAIVCVSIFR